MSESYQQAKILLDSLVYAPLGVTGGENDTAGQQQQGLIPFEQQALFRRLRSFTVTTWFAKPPGLQPCDCASKGWRNTGPDMLTCDSCGAQVWVKLPSNPLSEQAVGVTKKFIEQLTAGHDPLCVHSSQNSTAALQQGGPRAALHFPVVPSRRLASSFSSRMQEIQRLDVMPNLQPSALSKLVTTATLHLQDSVLLNALASLLQVPAAALQQAAVGQQFNQLSQLSRTQAAALLALCGWRVQRLMPDDLIHSTAATSANTFAVSHLMPQQQHSSSSIPGSSSSSSRSSNKISSAYAVLECELCCCRVGVWKYCCCGPFYAAQMASKAAAIVASAALPSAAAAAATALSSAAAAAATALPSAAAAAATAQACSERADGLQREAASPAAAEVLAPSAAGAPTEAADTVAAVVSKHHAQQQQQQQCTALAPAAVVPADVKSSLMHTIAGGSLLAAPTAGPFGHAAASSGSTFGGTRRDSMGVEILSPRLGPFGSSPAQASRVAAAAVCSASKDRGGSPTENLFGLGGSVASVFEGLAAAAGGPSGASPSFEPAASQGASPAPVFGLRALSEEEQRVKRRRSSSGAAMGPPGMSSGSGIDIATVATAGNAPTAPTAPAPPPAAAAAAQIQSSSAPAAVAAGSPHEALAAKQAKPGGLAAAAAAATAKNTVGGAAGVICQPSLLAAAAACNNSSSVSDIYLDPINQHRPWCPWVHTSGLNNAAAAGDVANSFSTGGLPASVPALRLGWSSTLLALADHMEDEEVRKAAAGQQAAAMEQIGAAPQPGQFGSTAAVLEQARQVLDALE